MLDLIVPAGTALRGGLTLLVPTLLVLALSVALWRGRRSATRERIVAQAELAAVRTRLEEVERRLASSAPHRRVAAEGSDYVITHLGDLPAAPRHATPAAPAGPDAPDAPRVEPALFADLVLRESVVRAASLAHGVRVALAPQTRNRIRFEVRREVRRARKERRTETRLARRELAARGRATLRDDEDAA